LVLSDRENPADFQLVFDSEKPVEERSIGVCPRCGAPVIETKPGFICARRSEGCRFAIWKTYKDKRFQKVRVSASMAKKLLAGQTLTSKRMMNEAGELHEGAFRLGDKGGDYGAFLTPAEPKPQS
jgi:DNA topoisomerase-3